MYILERCCRLYLKSLQWVQEVSQYNTKTIRIGSRQDGHWSLGIEVVENLTRYGGKNTYIDLSINSRQNQLSDLPYGISSLGSASPDLQIEAVRDVKIRTHLIIFLSGYSLLASLANYLSSIHHFQSEKHLEN